MEACFYEEIDEKYEEQIITARDAYMKALNKKLFEPLMQKEEAAGEGQAH